MFTESKHIEIIESRVFQTLVLLTKSTEYNLC